MRRLMLGIGLAIISARILAAPSPTIDGNFEQLNSAGFPIGWAGGPGEGTAPGSAGIAFAPKARNGHNAMRLFSKSGTSVAILNQSGTEPILKGVVSFWYKAISSSVNGQNLAFYVIPFTKQNSEGGAARTLWSVPANQVGDGQWHHASFKYDYVNDFSVVAIQLCPRVNETSEVGSGEWMVSGIRLQPLPYSTGPKPTLQAFGANLTPLVSGKPFDLVFTVTNRGRNTADGLHTVLQLSPGLNQQATLSAPTDLAPNSSTTFKWRCYPTRGRGLVSAAVRLSSADAPAIIARWSSPVLSAVGTWPYQPHTLTVSNGKIRLCFPPIEVENHPEYGVCSIQKRMKDGWLTVAVIPHLAQIITTDDLNRIPPLAHVAVHSASAIQFSYPGRNWVAIVSFHLSPGSDLIKIAATLRATRSLNLLAFRCPDLRIGEGTFGGTKHDAIFPGLEYLNASQPSSSTEFVDPPDSNRWTPNLLHITIPMMSLSSHGVVVVLTWNAYSKWNGVNMGYSAQFACPNRPLDQSNTRMALFVPTVPKWVPENGIMAQKPYRLEGGRSISIRSNVIVQNGNTALDGVKTVERNWGLK